MINYAGNNKLWLKGAAKDESFLSVTRLRSTKYAEFHKRRSINMVIGNHMGYQLKTNEKTYILILIHVAWM